MASLTDPQGSLSVRVLGRFSVERGGDVVVDATWRRRKGAAIIKILALQPGHLLERHRLVDLVWPDAHEASGANALHKALHFIRKDVDPHFVALEGPNVRLAPGTAVDIDAFERAAKHALAGTLDAASLERALALYRGDLLPENLYEPWAEVRRVALRESIRQIRLRLAQVYRHASAFDRAVGVLVPAGRDDPADEDVQQELMRLHALCGDRRAALRTYDALRDALYDDLGVLPAKETLELREGIAAGTFEGASLPRASTALEIRHVRSADGTRIAHTRIGSGRGVPLVRTPFAPWGHLEHDWEYPEYRRWLEGVATGRELYLYDGRGLGLSQHGVEDISFTSQAADLDAVVEAARLESFDMFVGPDEGPMAFTYVSRPGSRVRRMVLQMTWMDGSVLADGIANSGLRSMMRTDWETYCLAGSRFVLGMEIDHEWATRHAAWMQMTPRDVVEDYLQDDIKANVTDVALTVRDIPILAVCVCQSNLTPLGFGGLHAFAASMPNVRLVEHAGTYAPWGVRWRNNADLVRAFLDAPDEDVAPGGGWKPPASALA